MFLLRQEWYFMKLYGSGHQALFNIMKKLNLAQQLALCFILLVAAILRFYHYSDWSLSNDELSALNRLRYDSFTEVMKHGVMLNDMHPPGIQAFLYILTG